MIWRLSVCLCVYCCRRCHLCLLSLSLWLLSLSLCCSCSRSCPSLRSQSFHDSLLEHAPRVCSGSALLLLDEMVLLRIWGPGTTDTTHRYYPQMHHSPLTAPFSSPSTLHSASLSQVYTSPSALHLSHPPLTFFTYPPSPSTPHPSLFTLSSSPSPPHPPFLALPSSSSHSLTLSFLHPLIPPSSHPLTLSFLHPLIPSPSHSSILLCMSFLHPLM
jgi:hypothetical protein